jgi:hypothetical protein
MNTFDHTQPKADGARPNLECDLPRLTMLKTKSLRLAELKSRGMVSELQPNLHADFGRSAVQAGQYNGG